MKHWYKDNEKRYIVEKILMEERFNNFSHYFNTQGNACWKGYVDVRDTNGSLYPANCDYNPLEIEIECLSKYPLEIPIVYDVKNILRDHGCIHLHPNSNKICYGLRNFDSDCDFHKEAKIVDLIPQVGNFIFNQWLAENNESVWAQDRLHGEFGILEQEIKTGNIQANILCPCGKNFLYKSCCMKKVECVIENLVNIIEKKENIKLNTYFKRNEKCPCANSLSKYKKCCYPRKYFIQHLTQFIHTEKLISFLRKLSDKSIVK